MEQILTRIQACEQLQEFCEDEQASTRLNFASKSSNGQILRAVENIYDHSAIPLMFPPFVVSGRACMTISRSTLAPARPG